MHDSDSEVYPRHEMVYHTKAGTALNRNAKIVFKSILGQKDEENSEYGIIKTVSSIMTELKKQSNNTYPTIWRRVSTQS